MTEEASTVEETGLDWLEERKSGLGGSDAAAALGYSKYDSPADVFDSKQEEAIPKAATPAMERGTILEPIVADMWKVRTGLGIRRQPMRRHKEHDCIIGNIDRQVFATDDAGTSLLEIKCPGLNMFQEYKLKGLNEDIICQIMHYLAVYGYDQIHVALFNAEKWELLKLDPIERDDSFIAELVDREVHFWKEFVMKGVRPPEEIPDLPDLPAVGGGELVTWTDPADLQLLLDLHEARILRDDAKALAEMADQAVKDRMGTAVVIEGEGHRIYFREQAGRKSLDKPKLAAAGIDISQYQKQGNPFRVFKPYFDIRGGKTDE